MVFEASESIILFYTCKWIPILQETNRTLLHFSASLQPKCQDLETPGARKARQNRITDGLLVNGFITRPAGVNFNPAVAFKNFSCEARYQHPNVWENQSSDFILCPQGLTWCERPESVVMWFSTFLGHCTPWKNSSHPKYPLIQPDKKREIFLLRGFSMTNKSIN